MRDLFQPLELKNLELPNSFVMTAAADNLTGEGGKVTDAQIIRLAKLAKRGVGLIITGGIGIHESARSSATSPNFDREDFQYDYERLIRELQKYETKIAAQLHHPGIWTSYYQNKRGREAVAPSIIENDSDYLNKAHLPHIGDYHPATDEEIKEIINYFAEAAHRAQIAGFDAVEIHSAHDSLISQFLSPITNKRSDKWGGSLQNRCRILCQIGKAVRKRVGDDYLVILKLGVEDGLKNGLLFEDGKRIAKYAAISGFDVLEISQGLQGNSFEEMAIRPTNNKQEGFFRDWCKEIKSSLYIKTIMTGGLRTLNQIQNIIKNNETDLIGMCRPFIREPDLIRRWDKGDHRKATCISCNKCTLALRKGMPLACYKDTDLNK